MCAQVVTGHSAAQTDTETFEAILYNGTMVKVDDKEVSVNDCQREQRWKYDDGQFVWSRLCEWVHELESDGGTTTES